MSDLELMEGTLMSMIKELRDICEAALNNGFCDYDTACEMARLAADILRLKEQMIKKESTNLLNKLLKQP